jgi:hypothetical protein
MEAPDFSHKEVAARLEKVLSGMPSDDAVAERLMTRANYVTTGEKVRRTRNGDVQKIGNDLLAAVAIAFEVDIAWLLTGLGNQPKPAFPSTNGGRRLPRHPDLLQQIDAVIAGPGDWMEKTYFMAEVSAAYRARAMDRAEERALMQEQKKETRRAILPPPILEEDGGGSAGGLVAEK